MKLGDLFEKVRRKIIIQDGGASARIIILCPLAYLFTGQRSESSWDPRGARVYRDE